MSVVFQIKDVNLIAGSGIEAVGGDGDGKATDVDRAGLKSGDADVRDGEEGFGGEFL